MKKYCKAQNLVHRDYSKHTYTHTGTHTQMNSDYTKLNLHSLKRAANRDLRRTKTAEWSRKHGRSTVLGKEMFSGDI